MSTCSDHDECPEDPLLEEADAHTGDLSPGERGIHELPREVRDVIQPIRLQSTDLMTFRCHPGVACFNACCSQIEIVLTPYDLLRLRERLHLSAEDFLHLYAYPSFLPKGQLPVAILRMDPDTGRCPFNADNGCQVYSDRPVTCRYYPLGFALMRREEMLQEESFYFLVKEDFCKGHLENQTQTVAAWRQEQGADGYDDMNEGWISFILKRRSAGDLVKTALPLSEMFYMASTNPGEFRRFVFNSTFLERYEVPEETREEILNNDAVLIEFAFDWLRTVVFGDQRILPKSKTAPKD